jgi:DNA-binding NtrC family response regulator
VRLISATNRDLIADVKAGRFREDLFYRLHVFPVTVPPLRERPTDIPALARHFLARFAAEEGKRLRLITPEALRVLAAFRWPGNIRQLENAVFRAVVLAESDEVGLAEFPQIAAQFAGAGPAHAETADAPAAVPEEDYEPVLISNAFADEQPFAPALGPPIAPGDTLALLDTTGEVRPLDEIEAELIRYAITHYRGQMSEVARRLQIGRSTLYRKLEALGMSTERAEAGSETGA